MAWLIFFVVFLVLALTACSIVITVYLLRMIRNNSADHREVELAQIALLSKLTGLLAASDVMAYQGIAYMDKDYPGDAPEAEDEKASVYDQLRESIVGGEDMSDDDIAALTGIYVN